MSLGTTESCSVMLFEQIAAFLTLNKALIVEWALTESDKSCEGAMPLTEPGIPEYAP